MNIDGLRVNHAGLDQAAEDMLPDGQGDRRPHEPARVRARPAQERLVRHAQHAYTTAKAKWDWAIQEMRDLLDESQPDGLPVERRVPRRRHARRRSVRDLSTRAPRHRGDRRIRVGPLDRSSAIGPASAER